MKLLVTYKMKNGSTEAFLSELSGMGIPEIVRAESGCLRYDYFLPADGSTDCVLLVEEWEAPCRYKAALRQRNCGGGHC